MWSFNYFGVKERELGTKRTMIRSVRVVEKQRRWIGEVDLWRRGRHAGKVVSFAHVVRPSRNDGLWFLQINLCYYSTVALPANLRR
jgi:hypothetical protein